MARIPIYRQQTQVSQAAAVPELRAANVGAEAIGAAVAQVGKGLQTLGVGVLRAEDEIGKAEAMKTLAQAKLDWTENFLKSQETAENGAVGFAVNFDKQYQEWANKTIEGTTSPYARRHLQSRLESLRQTFVDKALLYEVQENRAYKFDQAEQAIRLNAVNIKNNPFDNQLYERTLGETKAIIDSMSLTPEAKRKLTEQAVKQFSEAQVGGQIERDPAVLVNKASSVTAGAGFDPAVNFVLSKEGKTLVTNDAGKGPSQYGIVFQFHPDFDPKKDGAEKAKEIYLREYWNKLNLSDLPPKLAAVAFDTAVLTGTAPVAKMLAESGGDVNKMLQLRENYLNSVGQREDKKQYLQGWQNRTADLRRFVEGIPEAGEGVVAPVKTGIPGFDNLSAQEQLRYGKQAQTALNQREAVYRAEVKVRADNSNAMAADGITDPNPVSRADFIRAYGVEEGSRMADIYADNQQMAKDIQSMQSMPANEIGVLLSTRQPVAGENYDIQSRRFKILSDAAVRIEKMRKDDPAAYSMKSSPTVQNAYTRMEETMQNPNATVLDLNRVTTEYVTASLAEQERLGVASPKILTTGMMDNLVRRLSAANESAADLATNLEQTYGRQYFPQVMSELMAKNKLSPAMMIIPDLDRPDAKEIVSRLSAVKRTELEDGVDKTAIRDIKEYVTEHVAALRRTAVNAGPETNAQISAYQEIMERIAIDTIGRGVTTSPRDAANRANELLLGKYQFRETLRLPASLNSRDVIRGLDRVLRDQVLNVDPNVKSVDVPVDFTVGRTQEQAMAEWQSTIRARHFWASNNETTAAQLWAQGANGTFYRVMKDGKQITIPFDDALAATTRAKVEVEQRVNPAQLQRRRLAEETRRMETEMNQE